MGIWRGADGRVDGYVFELSVNHELEFTTGVCDCFFLLSLGIQLGGDFGLVRMGSSFFSFVVSFSFASEVLGSACVPCLGLPPSSLRLQLGRFGNADGTRRAVGAAGLISTEDQVGREAS